MTALIQFVLAVLAGAMMDDADLDEVFSDSLDMVLDAVQHPLEVGGVVGSAAVIVIDHLLVLIITQARRSRLWRSIPSLGQLQTAQRILFSSSSLGEPYPASAGFSDRTGKSLSRPAFLRPVHGLHIGCDIPGFLDR